MSDFSGAKIALFLEGKLVVYLRDNKPGLRFAGMWDFPGGGREKDETPLECITREVQEEFCITLKSEQIIWQKEYTAMHDDSQRAYFFVANVSQEQVNNIQFGEEGQRWKLMTVESFLSRDDAIPALKGRLSDYLALKGLSVTPDSQLDKLI